MIDAGNLRGLGAQRSRIVILPLQTSQAQPHFLNGGFPPVYKQAVGSLSLVLWQAFYPHKTDHSSRSPNAVSTPIVSDAHI
jgi:hypothetical protein